MTALCRVGWHRWRTTRTESIRYGVLVTERCLRLHSHALPVEVPMIGRMLKYSFTSHTAAIGMRVGATIRAVGVQQPGEICLWAEVPYDVGGEKLEPRYFDVIPTGGDLPDPGTYVGTVFDGPYVWHIYEVTP
jgi:hypothetical protein